MVEVTTVGGVPLPYYGYVEIEICIQPQTGEVMNILALVVEPTPYHNTVPLLIGTNVFGHLPSSNPWKMETKRPEEIGFVRSTKPITVAAGVETTLHGMLRVKPDYYGYLISTSGSETSLPGGLLVIPVLHEVPNADCFRVSVRVRNLTSREITIPAKAELCCEHCTGS